MDAAGLRRRRLLLAAAAAGPLAGCATGPSRDPADPDAEVPVERLADGVWRIPADPDAARSGRRGNAGFVVGDTGVLAVDAGTSLRHGRAILRAIRRTTPRPLRALLLTHTKPEFLFGAGAFREAGVPVLMQRDAAALMAARCATCLRNLQRELGEAAMAGTALLVPDEVFDDAPPALAARIGRAVAVRRFAHASGPGDSALFDAVSGVLFAGGLADVGHVPDLHDADLPGWRAALDRLQADAALRLVVPAHGPPAAPAAAFAPVRGYLDALEARVRALVEAGTALSALPTAAALPAYAGWSGYATVHRRNAADLYLRLERDSLGAGDQPPGRAGR